MASAFKKWQATFSLVLLLLATSVFAQPRENWHDWLNSVRAEAISKGLKAQVVDRILSTLKRPSARVLKLDRNQPERRITFLKYRNTRADAYRIKIGRQMYMRYLPLLQEVSAKYHVSPCFILSLWGLESSYGRFMGKFPVIQSLATLAYDSRRSAFFRKQLFYAMKMIADGHVKQSELKGEWAGASGHSQFLPSSWCHFAVDYDGDGKKDIWKTKSDAFASIANYLIQHGWQPGQPWALPVILPHHFKKSLIKDKVKYTVNEWQHMGIRIHHGQRWPKRNLEARVVYPEGGPAMLAFNNFDVIMRWNRSTYYAGTVGYMADEICRGRQ